MKSTAFINSPALWLISTAAIILPATGLQAQNLKDEIATFEGRIRSAERKVEKLNNEIAKIHEEMGELDAQAEEAHEVQKAVVAKMEDRKVDQDKARVLENQIRNAMALITAYRDGFRTEAKFEKGEELGDIKLKDGRTITDSTITALAADKIQVRHSNGFQVLYFSNLPIQLQDRITHPPESAPLDAEGILAVKPGTLVTKEETASLAAVKSAKQKKEMKDAVENRRLELIARTEKLRRERDQRNKQISAERSQAMSDQKARLAQNQQVNSKIDSLEDEIETLKDANEAQDELMAAAIFKLGSNAVKTSVSDYNKIKEPYLKKMTAIRNEIAKKEREINVLKKKLVY